MNRLKIALQKEGRLSERSYSLLQKMGLSPEKGTRSFVSSCQKFPLDILFLRDDDIPNYVESGAADLGIVGKNVVLESEVTVQSLMDLPFGYCNLSLLSTDKINLDVIQYYQDSAVDQISNSENILKIATSHPMILKKYLKEKNMQAQIVFLSGSVELAPRMNIADLVFDIVSSGKTALLNGLTHQKVILKSQAQLIETKSNIDNIKSEKEDLKEEFLLRLKAALSAEKLKYLMMNVPKKSLQNITDQLPAARSPSIMPLADPDLVAVHIVLSEDEMWKNLIQFRKLGASDIILSDVQAYMR